MNLSAQDTERFRQFRTAYTELFSVLKEQHKEGEASDLAYQLARTAVPMSDDELKHFKIAYAKYCVNGRFEP
jgi:hypothetical protein